MNPETETSESLLALANYYDQQCVGEPLMVHGDYRDRAAELRARAKELERSRCTCGHARAHHDSGGCFGRQPGAPTDTPADACGCQRFTPAQREQSDATAGKPTAGLWDVRKLRLYSAAASKYAPCPRSPFANAGGAVNVRAAEIAANARLIAEAGAVYHETGLTPRQLAEERDAAVAKVDCWLTKDGQQIAQDLAKCREQLRQMIDGKVADDNSHKRTIELISERQTTELRPEQKSGNQSEKKQPASYQK